MKHFKNYWQQNPLTSISGTLDEEDLDTLHMFDDRTLASLVRSELDEQWAQTLEHWGDRKLPRVA